MDIGRHRYNFEGLSKKFTYFVSINKGRMTKAQGACVNFVISSIISYLCLLAKNVEE